MIKTINNDLLDIIKDMPTHDVVLDFEATNDQKNYKYTCNFVIDQIAAYSAGVRTVKIDVAYKRVGKVFAIAKSSIGFSNASINKILLTSKTAHRDFNNQKEKEQKDNILVTNRIDLFGKSRKFSKFRLSQTGYIDLINLETEYVSATESDAAQNAKDIVKDSRQEIAAIDPTIMYSRFSREGKDPAKQVIGRSLLTDAATARTGIGKIQSNKLDRYSSTIASTTSNTGTQNSNLSKSLQAKAARSLSYDTKLPYTFYFPTSIAPPGGKLTLIAQIRDEKGKLIQKKSFEIDHTLQIQKYIIPGKLPSVGFQKVGINNVRINVFNSDHRIASIKVFNRSIKNYQTNAEQSAYIDTQDIASPANTGYATERLAFSQAGKTFIRSVPVLQDGTVLGNFDGQDYQKREVAAAGIIYSRLSNNTVYVTIANTPSSYEYVQLIKRSVTLHRKVGVPVGLPRKIVNGTSNFIDDDIKFDHLYEYTAILMDSRGYQLPLYSKSLIKTERSTAGTKIAVSLTSTVAVNDGIKRTFNITLSLVENTDTAALLQSLKDLGTDQYFKDELDKLSGDLTSITKVKVTRVSLADGEIKEFGVVSPGIFEDTTNTDASYIFEGFLRNQADLFEEVANKKVSPKNIDPRDALQRGAASASALTDIPSIAKKNFTQKFFSKKSFLRGTLSYGITKATAGTDTGFYDGALGISDIITVNQPREEIIISNIAMTAASSNRRLIKFRVPIPNLTKTIDFFVISTIRGGIRSTIGTCHYNAARATQNFVDLKTELKVGELSYVITPINYSGEALQETVSKSFKVL